MTQSPSYSRTRKSLRNSIVSLLYQLIALVIGFFARKIFLDCLGTEVLGLNTTATSLLYFLNLAELGVGTAIAVTLYKPIFENDRQRIREIVALQGWLYKKIAYVIIIGSLVMMAFFPLIFKKMELPLWYAYASYGVLLYSSLLGYFFNYKQILLTADQNEYKLQYSYKTVMVVKLVCQAVAVKHFENGYVWWLLLEAGFATLAAISLRFTVNHSYPYIREKVERPQDLRTKYPEITRKVKQVFFQKISSFVLNQTSPIIIYAFASLSLVAIYGNYMVLVTNLTLLLTSMFTSMGASVGNMVAEGNRTLIMKVFRELFSSRFLMVFVSSLCIWILADPFIRIWVGEQYLLDSTTLLLIIIIFFLNTMRSVVDSYINAYGMFHDIWAPVAEAVINLSCSILLGQKFGLHGILSGVIISQIAIPFLWKPFFLFRYGMKEPVLSYIWLYLKHLLAGAVCVFGTVSTVKFIPIDPAESIWTFLIYGTATLAIATVILESILLVIEPGSRHFITRLVNTFKRN